MFSSNSSQVADDKLFSEDVFSTFVYTGNGSTQTITNGIDLAGKGGLVWIKDRNASPAQNHFLFDTLRGSDYRLSTNTTSAQDSSLGSQYLTSFNANGFSLDGRIGVNGSTYNYASWTFRKAPKFFDVVTYTGDGTANRAIPHSLGVAPGCIIVKQTSGTENWRVYHSATGNAQSLYLNTTDAALGTSVWNSTSPTSTDFTVSGSPAVNGSGSTYVAYLFAHDTTSDGIIQCGSYTGNGSSTGPSINLGWEAQWVLIKRATGGTASWVLVDNMRGMSVTSSNYLLYPNSTGADNGPVDWVQATATGFQIRNVTGSDFNNSGDTYIYIAIRRGPMRTPTSGTSVFLPAPGNNMASANTDAFTSGFPMDLLIRKMGSGSEGVVQDVLRGVGAQLFTEQTAAESVSTSYFRTQTGFARNVATNFSGWTGWMFRRAPSFFDEVCYTGTGSAGTINHNLGVAPELVITKGRGSVTNWGVYHSALGATKALLLNSTSAEITSANYWNNTAPTATQVSLGTTTNSSTTFVAYLFASCPGVSKVGSYTGNGSSQTINCGFAAGARFVMIKRTDSTGDWYVWDTARGIVAGNDPHLSLNTTAAEVTSNDTIDTDSSGFVVNQVSATNVNVSSATYIYLAVA